MVRIVALVLAASLMTTAALNVGRDNGFLAARMRPEVIAKMLSGVENNWKTFALSSSSCKTPLAKAGCEDAPDAFHKSCAKVVGSIIAASSGHVDVAKDYMGTVCANSPRGWHEATCKTIGSAVTAQMSISDLDNRNTAQHRGEKACGTLWSHFVDEEKHESAESKLQADMKKKQELNAVEAAQAQDEKDRRARAVLQAAKDQAETDKQAKEAHDKEQAQETNEKEDEEENNRQRMVMEMEKSPPSMEVGNDRDVPMEAGRPMEEEKETAPQPMEEETPQGVAKRHAERENLYEMNEKRLEAVSYLKAERQREQQENDDRATEGVHMAPMAKRVKLVAPAEPSQDEDKHFDIDENLSTGEKTYVPVP